jgi:hypothetical protein
VISTRSSTEEENMRVPHRDALPKMAEAHLEELGELKRTSAFLSDEIESRRRGQGNDPLQKKGSLRGLREQLDLVERRVVVHEILASLASHPGVAEALDDMRDNPELVRRATSHPHELAKKYGVELPARFTVSDEAATKGGVRFSYQDVFSPFELSWSPEGFVEDQLEVRATSGS